MNRDRDNQGNEATDVYAALMRYQTTDDWDFRPLVTELHRWVEIMVLEFKLKIPALSLAIDWLPARTLGHYRCQNGFGLRNEIAINQRHLDNREQWEILGTLLHELLHSWQQSHGRPGQHNYHNVQFRRKAADYGLIVDSQGHTQYQPDSPFFAVLDKYGVAFPPTTTPAPKPRGHSKLKLWTCSCPIRVRVAVADFRAMCLRCNSMFELRDDNPPRDKTIRGTR